MGLFDSAKDAASEHGDKVEEGVDKAAEFADDKTGGEHSDKIDQAKDAVSDKLGDGN